MGASRIHCGATIFKGLASVLDVRCMHCNELKKVATVRSKYSDTLRNRFDVNFKLGIGMIDTGIGEAQVNTFLSALDIHPVSKSLLKRHERDAGLTIERLAKESCQKSIELERQLTIASERSNFPTVDSSNVDQSAGS
ncbi:hypothetical protein DBV15_12063, partial [Temnothorax longispinosus]